MAAEPSPQTGGASYLNWNLGRVDTLDAAQQAVLLKLGAAVVSQWSELPRHVQRGLFEAAACDTGDVREHLARFLHDHGHPADADLAPGIA